MKSETEGQFIKWWSEQDSDKWFVTKEEMCFSMDEYCIERVARDAYESGVKGILSENKKLRECINEINFTAESFYEDDEKDGYTLRDNIQELIQKLKGVK